VSRQQHTGEDRPQVILGCCSHDLAQGRGEGGGIDSNPLSVGGGEARVILGWLQPQRRREPPGGQHRLIARHDHGDRARLELANDLTDQLRNDGDAGLLDFGRHLHPVGDLEVGTDELQAVTRCRDPKVLKHRQRATTAGDSALGSRDGVSESVTLAPELHHGLLGFPCIDRSSGNSW
jgi:hypothetical protein